MGHSAPYKSHRSLIPLLGHSNESNLYATLVHPHTSSCALSVLQPHANPVQHQCDPHANFHCSTTVTPMQVPCNFFTTSEQLPYNPCAVSGHHGSVISCASLPDDSSLPQPDFINTAPPLSRQVSEAASSCFDSPESLSNTAASAEIQASAGSRSSLRHNRAVSWSPECSARLNAVRPTYEHGRIHPDWFLLLCSVCMFCFGAHHTVSLSNKISPG